MCLNGRWEHGQTPAASGVGPVFDHPVWSHRAPATGRNQSLTPSFQTIPCLILIPKLFYIRGNGASFIWEGKWYKQSSVIFRICWEEKAFIPSGTSWALQKRSFDKAEKPLIMQKRHLILAETFNKCVMFGGNQFQLWSYRKMECPTVTLSVQHSMGHHWSLILATQLSEVVVVVVTGAWVITDGQQWKQAWKPDLDIHGAAHGRVWLMKDGDLFQVTPFTVGLQKRTSYLFNEISN